MSQSRRLPERKFLAAAGVLAIVGLVGVRSITVRLEAAVSGADPASAFHPAVTPVGDIEAVVTWERDLPTGRPMEPDTRKAITTSYAAAWASLDRAAQGDPDAPLTAYLSGGALQSALAGLPEPDAVPGTTPVVVPVVTRHLSHRLQLTSYSDDGSIVGFEVLELHAERIIDPDGAGGVVDRSIDRLTVVMALEDGRWRVRLMERTGSEAVGSPIES